MVRTLILAGSLCYATTALADQVSGDVLAFDRMAGIIVLADRSVWSLRDGQGTAPDDLEAGDRVTIDFQTISDNGVGRILAVSIVE